MRTFKLTLNQGLSNQPSPELALDNRALCSLAAVPSGTGLNWSSYYTQHVNEAKRRGLSCGVGEETQTASEGKFSATHKSRVHRFAQGMMRCAPRQQASTP